MVAMQVRAALHRHGHLAENHYFAVDYTGCIHEAPDRETTIKWAEDFARTANGGAIGSERPEVAAAIGSLARRAAVPSEQEPVAWRSWAGAPGAVSVKRPDGVEAHTVVETIDTDGRRAISRADRVNWNIELSEDGVWVTHWRFAHPAPAAGVKVKPLEWVRPNDSSLWRAETALGTYRVWYRAWMSVPEAEKWLWRLSYAPFGREPSGTADNEAAAKAAAQADYEARVLSALDTGEPK